MGNRLTSIRTLKNVAVKEKPLFLGTNQAHFEMFERDIEGLLSGHFTDNPLEALLFAYRSANRHYPCRVWHPPMSVVVLGDYDENLVGKISTQQALGLGTDKSEYFGVTSIRGIIETMYLAHYPESSLDIFVKAYCGDDEHAREVLEGVKKQINKKRAEDLITYGLRGYPTSN